MIDRENIVICDCCESEISLFNQSLKFDDKRVCIKSHIANWKRTSILSELRRYAKYFAVAFKYFLNRKKYDTIIGWQQFYALIFGFFCSVFHTKKTNRLIAINFTYKEKEGKLGKIYFWFMKRCLETGYVDYIHVPSQNYAKIVSETFNFSKDNIIVIPFGINDPYESFSKLSKPVTAPNNYVLSIGRSNRDYDFLIDAWKNIDYPLIIISDTYGGSNKGNENIQILKDIAGEESYPWIANCDGMIIPIDDGSICSGDTVLLTSLAMKKKVVITAPSTLAEMYINHEENGLITPKDKNEFEIIVKAMLFSDKYDYLQENARQSYLNNYSRNSMGEKVTEFIIKS